MASQSAFSKTPHTKYSSINIDQHENDITAYELSHVQQNPYQHDSGQQKYPSHVTPSQPTSLEEIRETQASGVTNKPDLTL